MGKLRYEVIFLLGGLVVLIMGCAGFSYRYYGLQGMDYTQGTLLGDKVENDLPFTVCAPGPQLKNPCVIMKASEFFKMKQDYDDTKRKLLECESR